MNRFIIADPLSCIACHTCEAACAVAKAEGPVGEATFLPRLTLIKHAFISTPVVCRQCDDAPCLNACPNSAIVYAQDSVQVLQARCIGCKSCMIACPYGVIRVQSVQVNGATRSQAIKCNLCVEREDGPACIPSCPTDALRLVDPDALNHLLQQRQLQTALNEAR